VQIFHGLAGEKKGHFRIRAYFDLYLTQGPYFTDRFKELSKKHKNFDVAQTGSCKLDKLFTTSSDTLELKKSLLEKSGAKNIILYAPTFSPSLTSAISLKDTIVNLSKDSDNLVVIKFHDKMDKNTIELYKSLQSKNLQVIDSDDITPLLQISDIMISDTSSVVYEFLLLDKPAVTLNSASEHINWANFSSSDMLYREVTNILQKVDNFKDARAKTIELYHPYSDGKSSARMIDATKQYITKNGVPTKRRVPLLRKLKMLKAYKGK
jgi:CDP-glycerol glycerophosphotransferase (TagB/SpsB family)